MAISTTPRHPRRDLKGRPLSDSQGDDPRALVDAELDSEAGESLFSLEELMALCSACIQFQPQTEHDLLQIMRWAEQTRVDAVLLRMMLAGQIGGVWVDEMDDMLVGRI